MEDRRRRDEIRSRAKKLESVDLEILAKLSLTERGFSPYELERRGISQSRIMRTVTKLLELGVAEIKSEMKTSAGRRIVRYTTNSTGAQIALDYLMKNLGGEIKEDKLREMADGDFESTSLGAVYKQLLVKKESGRTKR
jgi:predicted transcriptional regulator